MQHLSRFNLRSQPKCGHLFTGKLRQVDKADVSRLRLGHRQATQQGPVSRAPVPYSDVFFARFDRLSSCHQAKNKPGVWGISQIGNCRAYVEGKTTRRLHVSTDGPAVMSLEPTVDPDDNVQMEGESFRGLAIVVQHVWREESTHRRFHEFSWPTDRDCTEKIVANSGLYPHEAGMAVILGENGFGAHEIQPSVIKTAIFRNVAR